MGGDICSLTRGRGPYPESSRPGLQAARSALLFAGRHLRCICAPAFQDACPGGVVLLRGNQPGGAAGTVAGGVLAALVAKGIIRGTDLRGVCPACKIHPVAGGEPAGRPVIPPGTGGAGLTVPPPGVPELQPATRTASIRNAIPDPAERRERFMGDSPVLVD